MSETETVDAFGVTKAESYQVGATLPPAVDDSGPLLIRTQSDEGFLRVDRTDGDATVATSVGFSAAAGRARETCATVTAIDVAGNATPFDEPICAHVGDDGVGCAQAPPALPLCLLSLVGAVRSRARRR